MHKTTQLKRWYTIADPSQSQNLLQTKSGQFGSSIPLNLLQSISALKWTVLPIISQTARSADLYLLHSYLMRRGPERNFKYDLALRIIKHYSISTVIEALKMVCFSPCDSLTALCIYSTSQVSTIIQFHHYSQLLCPRSTSKHYTQEAWNQPWRSSTSRSSLSKPGTSFFISACHPPNFI